MNISKILNYWSLCELSDFESFKLNDKEIIKFDENKIKQYPYRINKIVKDEYKTSKITKKLLIDKNKKININKLYLGLIKKETIIKYLAEQLYEVFDSDLEESIEKLKLNEYTYLGYIYLDHKNDPISINNKSLVINPIFYILKYLKYKTKINNYSFKEFRENINKEYNDYFKIEEVYKNIIVPSSEYMLKNIKILNNNNPFKFWNKENTTVLILDSEVVKLKEFADKNNEKAIALYNYLKTEIVDKDKKQYIDNIRYFKNTGYILNTITTLANIRQNCFYYLVIDTKEDINKEFEMQQNIFIYNFLKSDEILENKIYTSNLCIKNGFVEVQKYLLEKFNFARELLYKEENNSIFYSKYKFDLLDSIENEDLISYYLDALLEKNSKITELYIKGKSNRIDVNNIESRIKLNSLEYFKETKGKWAKENPLYYAQQMAVNLFMSKYNKPNNLFSVNGPPGTGKTTLLKDVIANIHIKKIDNIIELNCEVFNEYNFNEHISSNYEIIVTSNNNFAVENLSLELPKINEFNFEFLGYKENPFLLSKYSDLFYEIENESGDISKTWNIFSLRLGKADNFNSFRNNFSILCENIQQDNQLKDSVKLKENLDTLLSRYKTIKEQIEADEKKFKTFDEIPILEKNINNINVQIETVSNKKVTSEKAKKIFILKVNIEKNKLKQISEQMVLIEKRVENQSNELKSYSLLSKYIFKRNSYKKALDDIKLLRKEFDEILKNKQNISLAVNRLEKEYSELKKEYDNCLKNLKNLNEKLEDEKLILSELNQKYKNKKYYICDRQFFDLEEDKIQRDEQLYKDERYTKNKSKLFLLALQISENLFIQNIDKFKKSIDGYLNNYKKNSLTENELKQLQNQFSSMFFIFPIVSTALASSYNMLKNIKRFGTIICDESGQATPQSIIGCLNRAKNALIVGDPLQVEPVFTVPNFLINLLNKQLHVDNKYSPLESSVQSLSDLANEFGSYYKIQDTKTWVGMPLVTHRRCLEPMFFISNHISYNNKMVLATEYSKNDIDLLPESCWIDVVSQDDDFVSHGSKKEIKAIENFIVKYKHLLSDKFFVISPFKSISSVTRNSSHIKEHGTVHTFQGKEADVVFLVLGGNNKKPGAKIWASEKANILNVAVTRAKKRVYIVGNYEEWSKMKYFNFASKDLNRVSIEEIVIS
ncbi:AAA domain-containing protein [Aliarcobacter lanthieri]|uniref:DEAD/DEAH box helicase n=1 Tax=Aliarcobacter lanthieri TaxID=1355374 RepID=UPI003AAC878B